MTFHTPITPLSRRELLAQLGKAVLAYPLLNMTMFGMSCGGSGTSNPAPLPGLSPLSDDQFLDEIQRAIFLFFWEQAGSTTGQVKDRAFAAGNDTRTVSSIAATRFGLSALCIADQRGYMASADIAARVRNTLNFLLNQVASQNGFFYHFVDMNTGQRVY